MYKLNNINYKIKLTEDHKSYSEQTKSKPFLDGKDSFVKYKSYKIDIQVEHIFKSQASDGNEI